MEKSKFAKSLFYSNRYSLELQKRSKMERKKGSLYQINQVHQNYGDRSSKSEKNEVRPSLAHSEKRNIRKYISPSKQGHQQGHQSTFDTSSKKNASSYKNGYSSILVDLHRDRNSSVSSSHSDSYPSGSESLKSDNDLAAEIKEKNNSKSRFPKLQAARKEKNSELKPESFRKPLLKREKEPTKSLLNTRRPSLMVNSIANKQISPRVTDAYNYPEIFVDERRFSFQETCPFDPSNANAEKEFNTNINELESRDTDTPSLAYATPSLYAVFLKSPRLGGEQYLKIRFPQDLDKLREMRKPFSSPMFTSSTCSSPDSEFEFFVR